LLEKWADQRPLRSHLGSLDDLRPVELAPYWPKQLQRDLRAAQRRIANLEARLANTRGKLAKVRGRARRDRRELDQARKSRVWKARNRAVRLLRRTDGPSKGRPRPGS